MCQYIWVVKILVEKNIGGQKKLGGIFQGGKKVAAIMKNAENFNNSEG